MDTNPGTAQNRTFKKKGKIYVTAYSVRSLVTTLTELSRFSILNLILLKYFTIYYIPSVNKINIVI